MAHDFDNYKSALSEGGALAVVVEGCSRESALDVGWHGFPESSGGKAKCGAAPGGPGLARRVVAPHTGGGGSGGSDPPFSALVRHRAGGGGAPQWSHHLPSPVGVAPSTVIPGGKANEHSRGYG